MSSGWDEAGWDARDEVEMEAEEARRDTMLALGAGEVEDWVLGLLK
jgi:hypothetical protein